MSNKDKLHGGERHLIGQWKLQCELMTLEKKIYELFWSGDHSTIDEIIDNPVEETSTTMHASTGTPQATGCGFAR